MQASELHWLQSNQKLSRRFYVKLTFFPIRGLRAFNNHSAGRSLKGIAFPAVDGILLLKKVLVLEILRVYMGGGW